MALCGALLTFAGAGSAEAQDPPISTQEMSDFLDGKPSKQKQRVSTQKALENMNRGMKGGMFSEQGKKPTFRVGADGRRLSGAPAETAALPRIHLDGGPMKAPTYRLPNGVVLQASEGIRPDPGVTCIAYCPPQLVIRRL